MSNGRGEVGLEIGADPGLSPGEYIQIPKLMKRTAKGTVARSVGSSAATASPDGAPTAYDGGEVYVHLGALRRVKTDGSMGNEVTLSEVPSPNDWGNEIRAFVAANTGHIRDEAFTDDTKKWVHAVRFWSLKAGFVASSKSFEYTEVNNPTPEEMRAVPDDWVTFIANYSGQAWTACTARATSWRKSNHATGGSDGIASGFPRRWLMKEALWSVDKDKARAADNNRKATSAFYVATHATSVHAVLALMVGTDEHHWAKIQTHYGVITGWDIRESAAQRIAPRTQVAGASMVADAVVVLKMLISENISGLLTERAMFEALSRAHAKVENEGMRIASYAGWFFSGHPTGVGKVAFNQKDASFAALVGELGHIAGTYYRGTTIGDSPALASASSQLASPRARDVWTQMSRIKSGQVSPALIAAYGRIAGAATTAAVESLISKDRATVTSAVEAYNVETASVARMFNVTAVPSVTVEQIMSNAEAADARAKQIADASAGM